MLSETIILQSAGSLSVAVMALLMLVLQILFFFRKPQFTWYAWSAAIAFSALLYSIGIFLEYNTAEGPLNRFSGLLEYTAIICLVHCLYGFTFSYLGIESKRYHPIAGVCHGLILILLWSTHYIVSENFTTRDFIGLGSPYVEPALGPLGPVFVFYAAIAGVYAMIVWIKHKGTDPKHRIIFLAGMGFWFLLGIHDGLASLGVPTFQYVMEYGFLGFAMVVLWVVFSNYLEIAAEEKYRVITEFANDGIMVIQDGKMVFGNPACCDLIGVPLTDSEPRDFLDIMVSEDRKTVLEHYNTLLEGGHVPDPHTGRIRGADGEERFVEIASSLIQYRNRPAVLAIMRDMTRRKRAEEALRESEDKFRSFAEQSLVGIYLISDDLFKYVNPKFAEIFGYSVDECLDNMHFPQLVHPEDLATVQKQVGSRLSGETKAVRYSFRGIKKGGETIHVEIFGSSMVLKGKSVATGTMLDITKSKRAEKALKESEGRLKKAQSVAKLGNWEYDISTGKIWGSEQAFRIYGIERTSPYLPLDRVEACIPDAPRVGQALVDLIQENKKYDLEFEVRHEVSGQTILIHSIAELVYENGMPVKVLGVIQDVTEQKKAEKERKDLEDQLQRAQKMEAIGTLAGGVAHDLNNILGGLVSYPELLLMQMPEDSPLRKPILIIQKSGEKAAAVVQDLLTLARRGVVITEVVNLNDVIFEYLKSPEHEKLQSYHPGVHIETHLEKDVLNILGSSTHLSKTVMNLISNGAEAMPEGGKLTVSMENRYIDRPIRGYDSVMEGDYVVLTISDTGTGISPEDIEKIFEPFYTKKKMGRSGTGLGMAVVWGTVKDHNGYIDVQSTEGKGTTFALYFPVTRKKLSEDKTSLSVEVYSGNGESILIVDDVEEQRQIASGMLQELGYLVVSVSSGEEAVEYLKTNKADLLVLDMIMGPGIDGLDTYKKIIETHPGQKAIIASGFSETDRVKKVQGLGAGAYIKKPFLLEKIGLAVKKELEK